MDNIAAGIVLYNPDINRLKENISSIIVQCGHVYLADNGSENFDDIEALINEFGKDKISLIRNKSNLGIAAALNQLCRKAEANNYNWLITLDQDSVSPSDMTEEYLKHTDEPDTAMLCPLIYDRNKKASLKAYSAGAFETDECITSGAMLRLDVWKELKGFDESMFIDGVDFDICHRIKKHGYKIICVSSVVLVHEIGHIEMHKFLVWSVVVKNHSAFRKYYIARNTVYLAGKEHTSLIKALLQNVKLLLINLLYENDKKKKAERIFKGTFDGLKCIINKNKS